MADLETLTERLELLETAHASGVLVVKHGDTSLTYRSIYELERAINRVKRQINRLNGVERKPGYVVQTTKGL